MQLASKQARFLFSLALEASALFETGGKASLLTGTVTVGTLMDQE